MDSPANVHFVRLRQQFSKAENLTDGTAQIQRPEACHQVEMTACGKVCPCPDAPFGLYAENSIQKQAARMPSMFAA
jgi:hypothetical protein